MTLFYLSNRRIFLQQLKYGLTCGSQLRIEVADVIQPSQHTQDHFHNHFLGF